MNSDNTTPDSPALPPRVAVRPHLTGTITSAVMELSFSLAPAKFVLLQYLHWHTLAQDRATDWLTRDDLENGKMVRGTRSDNGCGLYADGLDYALSSLLTDGYIRERQLPIFGDVVYLLNMENILRD